MTLQIDISKPGVDLKTVIDAVRRSDEVILVDGEERIARMIPQKRPTGDRSKLFGMFAGRIKLMPDFDELSAEEIGLTSEIFPEE